MWMIRPRGGDGRRSTPHVLVVCRWFPPRVGGVESYLAALYAHAAIRNAEIIAPRERGSDCQESRLGAAVVRRVGRDVDTNRKKVLWTLTAAVIHRVVRGHIGQIHCGHVLVGVLGLVCRVLFGIPYVVFAFGSELTRTKHTWLRRLVLQAAERVIVISAPTQAAVEGMGVPAERICIICPTVDSVRFRPFRRDTCRALMSLPLSRPIMLSVCRLDKTARHKGVDTALRAVSVMKDSLPEIYYVVAGDGDDLPRLQGIVREFGIESHVHFVGAVDAADLPRLYAAADVFVLPNRREVTNGGHSVEGFGIVLLEAASAGLPLVATPHTGGIDVVRHGETGVLVRDVSADGLAAALLDVVRDRAARTRMGSAARVLVQEKYTGASAGAKLTELTAAIESGSRGRRPSVKRCRT